MGGFTKEAWLKSAAQRVCKLPVFLLHYVIAEKGVGHAIYGEDGVGTTGAPGTGAPVEFLS